MEDYSEKQIENWDKSKRIVRYKSKQQLEEFVAKAISDKSFNKKMYFGIVPKALAKRILDDFGVDISNKNVSLSASEIRKIMEDHGTLEEIKRGQKQIEASDFLRIIDVFEDTDEISPAGDYNGRPAFNYIKRKEGRTVVFAYDSVKRNDLIVQTMYINVKKEDLATPTGEQAPINTPEANNGTVFPNGKILLSKKNSNSLSDKNMTVQDGKARWTDERIDSLIEEYGASNENYSQTYAVMMNPRDYLKLTLSDEMLDKWNEDAAKDEKSEVYQLDEEKLKANTQTPYLTIYSNDGTQVQGHEGRYRMRTLKTGFCM